MTNPIVQALSWADKTPNVLAITGAGSAITFSSFKSSTKKIASMLRARGVKPGHVVGVRMHGALHGLFVSAIMHEGAVGFAAKEPVLEKYGEHIDFVFSDEADLVSKAKNGVLVDENFLSAADRTNSQIEPNEFESEDSPVHLVFSSGTTGTPKAVSFSVKVLEERLMAAQNNWMHSTPLLCELALDTISGMITFFHSIFNGQTYLVPSSAKENALLINELGVASAHTSPAKLKDLLVELKSLDKELTNLKEIQVVGGLVSGALAAEIIEAFKVKLTIIYGSTEAGAVTKGEFDHSNVQNVGKPLEASEVEIIDENVVQVPIGRDGTIRIKTAYQAKSYWNLKDVQADSFSEGWFYPGDRGRILSTGELQILGRVDEVVNLSGMKVDPGWIDARISSYRGIKDFACFSVPDESRLYEKLAIAIVFDDEINLDNFRNYLIKELGDSSPQAIVRVNEIARNSLGKPNRLKLRLDYMNALGIPQAN